MKKRVLILMGHPSQQSLCSSLADEYAEGAKQSGHAVTLLRLGDLQFDPILHEGYKVIQPLEPDLMRAQEEIKSANHLVFIYPNWWGSMPALLKGFFDRTFLPGFAFKYRENSPWWDKYLTEKTAHVLTTMDTPPWYYRLIYRSAGNHQIKKAILEFCGVKPVRITNIGQVKDTPDAWKQKWLAKAKEFGRNA